MRHHEAMDSILSHPNLVGLIPHLLRLPCYSPHGFQPHSEPSSHLLTAEYSSKLPMIEHLFTVCPPETGLCYGKLKRTSKFSFCSINVGKLRD